MEGVGTSIGLGARGLSWMLGKVSKKWLKKKFPLRPEQLGFKNWQFRVFRDLNRGQCRFIFQFEFKNFSAYGLNVQTAEIELEPNHPLLKITIPVAKTISKEQQFILTFDERALTESESEFFLKKHAHSEIYFKVRLNVVTILGQELIKFEDRRVLDLR